jgi:hypothetical protein
MKINKNYIGDFQKICLEEFRDEFEFLYQKHFLEAKDNKGSPYPAELHEQLDDYHTYVILSNIMEDMMTLDTLVSNPLDYFLETQDIPPLERDYFTALRHSVMSYYKVLDVTLGESIMVQDLLRDTPPQLVLEESGSQSAKKGMILAARVISVNDLFYFTGCLMPYMNEQSVFLAKGTLKLAMQDKQFLTDHQFNKNTPVNIIKTEILKNMVATFSWMYLDKVFAEMKNPTPTILSNQDGELLMNCHTAFVFHPKNRQMIINRLDDHPNLVCTDDDRSWCWIGDKVDDIEAEAKKVKVNEKASLAHLVYLIGPEGEKYISRGDLALKKKELVLETLSKERNSEGELMVNELLGELVTYKGTTFKSIEASRKSKVKA